MRELCTNEKQIQANNGVKKSHHFLKANVLFLFYFISHKSNYVQMIHKSLSDYLTIQRRFNFRIKPEYLHYQTFYTNSKE